MSRKKVHLAIEDPDGEHYYYPCGNDLQTKVGAGGAPIVPVHTGDPNKVTCLECGRWWWRRLKRKPVPKRLASR